MEELRSMEFVPDNNEYNNCSKLVDEFLRFKFGKDEDTTLVEQFMNRQKTLNEKQQKQNNDNNVDNDRLVEGFIESMNRQNKLYVTIMYCLTKLRLENVSTKALTQLIYRFLKDETFNKDFKKQNEETFEAIDKLLKTKIV